MGNSPFLRDRGLPVRHILGVCRRMPLTEVEIRELIELGNGFAFIKGR